MNFYEMKLSFPLTGYHGAIRIFASVVIIMVSLQACQHRTDAPASFATEITPTPHPIISRKAYYDKVLGMLIGSAIGDAIGAPTEMWPRSDIRREYGYINGLDSMVRAPSPEGTWQINLPAGGTTDDTRWKQLTIEYLLSEDTGNWSPEHFAKFMVQRYKSRLDQLKKTEGLDPEPYENNMMKVAWLQEWAKVARPYADNDLPAYSRALSKFYGGEMTCAGMLYVPVMGATRPADASGAYRLGYDHAIFDIGYARDMTGLTAAMVAAAMDTAATPASVINVNKLVDPEGYFKSRLVGRSAYRFYEYAHTIAVETSALSKKDIPENIEIPTAWQRLDTLAYLRLRKAYDMLDARNEDLAFHPGEIYLTVLTTMLVCDFDFEKTMTFIANYGRDNDTAGAIAGAILGAYWGAKKLPKSMKDPVLIINKQTLNIDLEALASGLTNHLYPEEQ